MLSVAKSAARDASELILHANEIDRETSNKSTITDLVTKTDKNAEQVIKDDILAKFPDHCILAEESGETKSSSEYLWVIDPLDGTTNFVHGLSPYCVSIALLKNNTPLLERLEKETGEKKDLFEAIQFQIDTLVVNADDKSDKISPLANGTIKHISEVN